MGNLPTTENDLPGVDRLKSQDDFVVGAWYWYREDRTGYKDETPRRHFVCITHIGSNYIEATDTHHSSWRIKFADAWDVLTPEPEAAAKITQQVKDYQWKIEQTMEDIKRLAISLGLQDFVKVGHQSPDQTDQRGLVLLQDVGNLESYQAQLIELKETKLPELFNEIKNDAKSLTRWMKAESLPLEVEAKNLQERLKGIDSHIHNVSLYSGIAETLVQFADGEPAEIGEKIKLMQRRLYMDEECLLGYEEGGMDFSSLHDFDEWVAKPANRDRLLPFARCVVAMRIRRHHKERSWDGGYISFHQLMHEQRTDEYTYLYIRNGENLYRLCVDWEFDELIFPNPEMFDTSTPMMVKYRWRGIESMITVHEYKERIEKGRIAKKLYNKWAKAHKDDSYEAHWKNPHKRAFEDYQEVQSHEPFNQDNLYYDDCLADLKKKMDYYNRVSLIIQGLIDRSGVFNPHMPLNIWKPEDFARGIELIYDSSYALNYGEAPDIERYLELNRRHLDEHSVMLGQYDYWFKERGSKYGKNNQWELERLDHGPERIARPAHWMPRAKKAKFCWERERGWRAQYRDGNYDPVPMSITVPASELFDVTAYQPGDYRQFFVDPRTREQYLKWAPLLLTAEEWHNDNRENCQ